MSKADGRVGIEFISALGLPPVPYAELVAQLGCQQLGVAPAPITRFDRYPPWSLRDDQRLRRDFAAALGRLGLSLSLGEGFLAWPDRDIRECVADLDLMCELGVPQVNLVSLDGDRGRAFDQCAIFAELAGARKLDATLEFIPGMLISDLSVAMEAVRHVARPNFRVLIDAMHFFRSGGESAQLAALDPAHIGYVQLCDVPRVSWHASYGDEARDDRLPPGEGELPLREFLQALPAAVNIGLEVPMLSRAKDGIGPFERLQPCVETAGTLLRETVS